MKIPAAAYRVFQKIEATCERDALIEPSSLILAAVSGGVDSMLLLAFLQYYRYGRTFGLLVCHLNHGIRGRQADLDEELVRSYCKGADLPFIAMKADVPAFAKAHGLGLEEAGRQVRRDRFRQLAADQAAAGSWHGYRIALAHHMDDRAESILMHMGRGSGLKGLVGIRSLDGPFIRPLLDIRRREVLEAARALRLLWREDVSNHSPEFLRNRIRRSLIPAWQEVLGYDPVPLLAGLGEAARLDDQALEKLAEEAIKEALLPDGSLSVARLAALDQAVRIRVLRRYLAGGQDQSLLSGTREPGRIQLEELSAGLIAVFSGQKPEFHQSLADRMTAVIRDGRFWVRTS